jgi:hypothetical protein
MGVAFIGSSIAINDTTYICNLIDFGHPVFFDLSKLDKKDTLHKCMKDIFMNFLFGGLSLYMFFLIHIGIDILPDNFPDIIDAFFECLEYTQSKNYGFIKLYNNEHTTSSGINGTYSISLNNNGPYGFHSNSNEQFGFPKNICDANKIHFETYMNDPDFMQLENIIKKNYTSTRPMETVLNDKISKDQYNTYNTKDDACDYAKFLYMNRLMDILATQYSTNCVEKKIIQYPQKINTTHKGGNRTNKRKLKKRNTKKLIKRNTKKLIKRK